MVSPWTASTLDSGVATSSPGGTNLLRGRLNLETKLSSNRATTIRQLARRELDLERWHIKNTNHIEAQTKQSPQKDYS